MSEPTGANNGEDGDSPLDSIATGAAMLVMIAAAAGLLALDVSWWWIAFPMGGALVPLFQGLATWYAGDEASEPGTDRQQDALDTLRDRYARGELTEAEFERRVERLLETETVEDARAVAERGHQAGADDGDREPATE